MRPENFFALFLFGHQYRLLTGNDLMLFVVDLKRRQTQLLVNVIFQILDETAFFFDQRCRYKNGVRTDFTEQAAFCIAADGHFEHFAVANGLDEFIAFDDFVHSLFG